MGTPAIAFAIHADIDRLSVARRVMELPGSIWFEHGFGGGGFFTWGPGAHVAFDADWTAAARALLRPGPALQWRGRRLFAGGLAGWIGYEAGRALERMPAPVRRPPRPELMLRRYSGALHCTNHQDTPWIITGTPAFVEQARALLDSASGDAAVAAPTGRVVERDPPERFLRGVDAIRRHIAAGDCYQVNLARRMRVRGVGRPLDAFLRLRESSPAAFGALCVEADGAILSNSPELFLRLEDGAVMSCPIKGTRPLGGPGQLERMRQELLDDPKEQAELTMIVDLVRNDLGRVCAPGSVRADPREVRTLPTLLHASQGVHGRLAAGRDVFDLLAATFPPGSVTGAPKVQAMSLIRELEPHPRGVYTGAIGFISDAGDATFNVAIRTATLGGAGLAPDEAWLHVGSGIVADSDPQRELEETELKAVALLRAFCM